MSVMTMFSCNDYETYAEQRDKELSAISYYIENHGIKVISESEFLANDTTTDVSKNEYVLLSSSGVYMQIINKGCGEKLKDGESTTVLSRFSEYNILGDSLQLSNLTVYGSYLEKYDLRNVSGTFYASFQTSDPGLMYQAYGSASVPEGWLVPLTYVNLGRPEKEGDEIAKVRIIVPHDKGQSYASSGVYPCLYTLTYQRGI